MLNCNFFSISLEQGCISGSPFVSHTHIPTCFYLSQYVQYSSIYYYIKYFIVRASYIIVSQTTPVAKLLLLLGALCYFQIVHAVGDI
jgi:hypothetical protein